MMSASVSSVWVAVSVVLAHVVPMFCHQRGGSAGSRFTIELNLCSSARMFAADPGLYAVLTAVAAVVVAAPAVATPVVGAVVAAALAARRLPGGHQSAGGWSAQGIKLPHSLKFPHPTGSSEAIEALQELESLRA